MPTAVVPGDASPLVDFVRVGLQNNNNNNKKQERPLESTEVLARVHLAQRLVNWTVLI